MAFKIVKSPSFQAAVQKKHKGNLHPDVLNGVVWTLHRNPHLGIKASKNLWIIKVCLAPIVFTIYYAIDEAKKIVHLVDVKP